MSRHSQNPAMASSAFGSDECERVVRVRDRDAGVTAILAVHDTRLGPAHGGIRRWRYDSVEAAHDDAVRLARAMTWKCALADLPAGGGKAVIVDHDGLDRQAAYRLVGRAVEQLGGRFFTGPDVGTGTRELVALARGTRFVAHPDGEAGDIARPTALGVRAAIEATAHHLGLGLRGLRVAIQGVGAVGANLARLLAADGAQLTLADTDAAKVAALGAETGALVVPPDAIVTAACDVFAPCALGGVIDADTVPRLRTRAVVGAANNQLVDFRVDAALFAAGILHVPDFVANAGGLIHGALTQLEGRVPAVERVLAIGARADAILARAARERRPPGAVALALAEERLAAAGRGAYFPRSP
jgi:leucine dehydrogenase